MAKINEAELKALIAQEITSAEMYLASDVAGDRETAIRYYKGELPDVPAMPGRSQYVSRDVSNVIGWTLPGIIRVFTASDRMVCCEPVNPEDEEGAEQASDYLNHVFMKDNNGYKILYDATHDALLNKDGIVKQYWDTQEHVSYHVFTGLSDDQIAVLVSDGDVEVVERSDPYFDQLPGPSLYGTDAAYGGSEMEGAPLPVALYDIKARKTETRGRLVYEVVPPENFIIDRNATDANNWRFMAQKMVDVTRSDLIEMGFDRTIVDNIPAFTSTDTTPEYTARHGYSELGFDVADKAQERVVLYEAYMKIDINKDGRSECVKIFYAGDSGGGEILDWEEYEDDVPFDKIPCNPVPHRWSSDSLADEVKDIQKFKTVMGRALFDNMYQVNYPTPVVEKGSIENMDAVVNPGIGAPIITKPGAAVNWNVTPFVGDKILMAMGHLDEVLEMRTGVSRASMSLDPETLQNQTATAVEKASQASYSQIELIARNQAELGWKKVFEKSLRIICRNQDRPRVIKLRNEWVEMDPRSWNAGMDVTINVGLGTGSRDRDMAILQSILNTQIMITDRFQMAGFADKALEMVPKVTKTLVKMAEAAGIKMPETFYPEVTEEDLDELKQRAAEAAQQPDPATVVEQQKMQMQMQVEQMKMQAAREKEMAQMEADVRVKQAELEKNSQLEAQRMTFDAAKFDATQELEREKMAMQYQIETMKLEHDSAIKALPAGGTVVKNKDGKGSTVKSVDSQNFEMMMAALEAMRSQSERQGAMIEHMIAVNSAPTEIVRDPATGRPVGARKVIN